MDPALNGRPDSVDWHGHANIMQVADSIIGLQDRNDDPEPGSRNGSPPEPFDYHGWRKLVRNFTPS